MISLAHLGHLTRSMDFAATSTTLSGCRRDLGNQSGGQEHPVKSVRGQSEAKTRLLQSWKARTYNTPAIRISASGHGSTI